MPWLIPIAAWLGSTALLAPVCFFAVIALAGPHGSILPESLHSPVLLAAWALLLGGPVWVASVVRRGLRARGAGEIPDGH